jgi:hypothetical protein
MKWAVSKGSCRKSKEVKLWKVVEFVLLFGHRVASNLSVSY